MERTSLARKHEVTLHSSTDIIVLMHAVTDHTAALSLGARDRVVTIRALIPYVALTTPSYQNVDRDKPNLLPHLRLPVYSYIYI